MAKQLQPGQGEKVKVNKFALVAAVLTGLLILGSIFGEKKKAESAASVPPEQTVTVEPANEASVADNRQIVDVEAPPVNEPKADHRAPIRDGAFFPITKQDAPELFRQWGQEWIDRINKATEEAVNITASAEKCDEVSLSGFSFDRSVPKEKFSVFVDCLNGERFYYTEAETQSSAPQPTALSESLAKITDIDAFTSCEALAKPQLNFPSTMDVSWLNSVADRKQFGINVALSFEAKNALGNEVPYVAYCVVTAENTELLSIKPR
ncbi:MAG: hypothetical protein M9939_26620 [Mesorhizobium sp.]|nr:hypothetical protein [Mesorhizobium sp.]MCO5085155.1 hypothetical protein [Rhizobiaceae bacterium]MCO5164668.1 hypothetical protein [Mesorhizobium sp.]